MNVIAEYVNYNSELVLFLRDRQPEPFRFPNIMSEPELRLFRLTWGETPELRSTWGETPELRSTWGETPELRSTWDDIDLDFAATHFPCSLINFSPKYSLEKLEKPDTCAICYENMDVGAKLTCNHSYHKACIDEWFSHKKKTCPLCRKNFCSEN